MTLAVGLVPTTASPSEELPVIDLHTHVFNLRYLPVRGILVARGVPKLVAEVLERLLIGATPLSDLSRSADEPNAADLPDLGDLSDEEARSYVLGRLQNAHADLAPGAQMLTPRERRALRKYGARQLERADRLPGEASDLDLVQAALDEAKLDAGQDKSYPRFLATLMQDEVTIVRLARRTYPDVDLMVHHLMDMERPYDERPSLDDARQIQRLAPLARRFPGELLGFVAFDPFRRGAALGIVQDAIERGDAVGVKFYPPSGYRARGNGPWPPKPSIWQCSRRAQWKSRYAKWKGPDLDGVNDELFAYCEARQVPLLAHCTPEGFEASSGYGAMSDPSYWRSVLERHPQLRLCLAHAGGGGSWFSDAPWDGRSDFDQRAWDLATRYPNVYLDFSYSNEVLDPSRLAALRHRLLDLLTRAPDPERPYALADKIVYGSDWHMVSVLEGRSRILTLLEELFAEPALAPYRVRFFSANAARYLRLKQLVEDPDAALDDAQREALTELLTRIDAALAVP